jgi:SAM-dependent methyltransferase
MAGPKEARPTTQFAQTAAARAARDQAHFDQVAIEYCRKDLAPASRRARRHRLLRTFAALPRLVRPKVLEAGCGGGFSATYLRSQVGSYQGLDYSEKLIELARRINAGPDDHFEVADVMAFTPPAPVDVVFMIGVLHHMPDVAGALRRMAGWLRPGGWLVANEPQPGNPLVQWARRLRKRVDAEYSDEQEELSSIALEQAFGSAGLENVRIIPQGLLSTPFAEVVLAPRWLADCGSAAACLLDLLLECAPRSLLVHCTWNLIAAGQRPCGAGERPG